MKNLEKLQLQELTIDEQVNIDGGWLKTVVGLVAGTAVYMYDNREKFYEGFKEGWSGK
ncbi:hypothetical protein [Empedobacter brevis]|uniref:hypothetical protein n=1 Tax=Empedobacter brevis TaxID=247 RepID=UPI0028ABA9A8|nr:hypothetical protein [Empedobacter brevis]